MWWTIYLDHDRLPASNDARAGRNCQRREALRRYAFELRQQRGRLLRSDERQVYAAHIHQHVRLDLDQRTARKYMDKFISWIKFNFRRSIQLTSSKKSISTKNDVFFFRIKLQRIKSSFLTLLSTATHLHPVLKTFTSIKSAKFLLWNFLLDSKLWFKTRKKNIFLLIFFNLCSRGGARLLRSSLFQHFQPTLPLQKSCWQQAQQLGLQLR